MYLKYPKIYYLITSEKSQFNYNHNNNPNRLHEHTCLNFLKQCVRCSLSPESRTMGYPIDNNNNRGISYGNELFVRANWVFRARGRQGWYTRAFDYLRRKNFTRALDPRAKRAQLTFCFKSARMVYFKQPNCSLPPPASGILMRFLLIIIKRTLSEKWKINIYIEERERLHNKARGESKSRGPRCA